MKSNDYIAVNEWNYIEPFFAPLSQLTDDLDCDSDVERIDPPEIDFYSEGQLICQILRMPESPVD